MIIAIGNLTLATHSSRVVGLPSSPAEARHSGEVLIQESNPIRAARRRLFSRGNLGGTLSFVVYTEFQTLAAAGSALMSWPRERPGTSGTLSVTPSGGGAWSITGAVLQSCECEQQGATIITSYTIEY